MSIKTVKSVKDSDADSLREIINKADNGDVIVFDIQPTSAPDANGNWTITLSSEIEIKEKLTHLTINGGGKIILDGNNKCRIFNYKGTGTLDFYGLVFQGGQTTDSNASGGAVLANDGIIVATDCTFTENKATKNGGAVYAKKAFTARDCAFFGNNAKHGGGAVATDGSVVVFDCMFSQNKMSGGGKDGGGAISANDSITATGCTFYDNSTNKGSGGAVRISKNANIKSSIFAANNAKKSGGAVFTKSGNIIAMSSEFYRNTANETGCAVYADKSITAAYCKFKDNNLSGRNDAMYSNNGAVANTDCTFL